ncbi:hypothetical protein ACH5RR_020925 [Cinchona calisaya]|uniref:Uncharacterized protein n=1 Tax=Cinchona calisaya TaxID=153742 RepID=A0ABD2ZHN4_9GENT
MCGKLYVGDQKIDPLAVDTKLKSGGGTNRMKQHLAGEKGSIVSCTKVAPEARHAILESLKETAQKAKEKRGDFVEENPFGHFMNDYDGDEVQEIPHL